MEYDALCLILTIIMGNISFILYIFNVTYVIITTATVSIKGTQWNKLKLVIRFVVCSANLTIEIIKFKNVPKLNR